MSHEDAPRGGFPPEDAAVRKSQDLLTLFIEHAPASLAMFDMEMRYLAASRRWITDYGLQGVDVLGRSHYEVFPEIPERWRRFHQRGLAGEIVRDDRDPFQRADGSVQWLRWEIHPWFDDWGRVGGIVIFTEDITAAEEGTAALSASEAQYRLLVEAANSVILRWDNHGVIRFINAFGERFFGYADGELLGRHVMTLVPATETSGRDLTSLADDVLRNPEAHLTVPNENVTKDGRTVWVAWTNKAIEDGDGQVREILSVGNDITALRKAEEALRASEAQRRLALDTVGMGTWRKDIATGRTVLDETARRCFGLARQEASFAEVLDRVHPDDREDVEAFMLRAQTPGDDEDESFRTSFRVRDGDGRVRWTQVNVGAEYQGTGDARAPSAIHGIIQDVTTERAAAEAHARFQERAMEVQRMESVGRLAGGVAHDSNNMLGIILGRVELALEDVAEGTQLHGNLREIQTAARRSADLTRQLLTYARRQPVSPRPLQLDGVVGRMVETLRGLVGPNVRVAWAPPVEAVAVTMDPAQVQEILVNLVSNARDAMEGEGVLTLEVAPVRAGDRAPRELDGEAYAVLRVGDNGRGMDEEVLAQAFEPFFTTKEIGAGVGLGLSTVYGIVKQNDGHIHVSTEPGAGTMVEIFLPLQA